MNERNHHLLLMAIKTIGNDGWEPAPAWFLAVLPPEERSAWETLNHIARQLNAGPSNARS